MDDFELNNGTSVETVDGTDEVERYSIEDHVEPDSTIPDGMRFSGGDA